MARRRVKRTRLDIIQCATTMFLEQGYTASSAKQIADELDIATGNLTYYFPTKEHMLAELVDISRQHLGAIEAPNIVRTVSLDLLFRIADVLEVDVRQLLDFHGNA